MYSSAYKWICPECAVVLGGRCLWGLERSVREMLEPSPCGSAKTYHHIMTPTHPLAFLPLQLAEEKLQLFHCDAVAGKNTQHVHQQVCKTHSRGQRLAAKTWI